MKRWLVLLGCMIGLSVSVGTTFWLALGLYLKPMSNEFGWTRTEFASAFSIATLVNVFMFPTAGYLVDKYGARRVIPVGIVLLALSYSSLSTVNSYLGFVVLACVVAGTGSLASYPAYLALPPKWFDKNLGLAIAIASAGIGIGSWCFPYIINASLQSVGWRQTFVIVGAIAFVVGIVNFLAFIRDNKGPLPEAERRSPEMTTGAVAHDGLTFSDALKTRDFWLLSGGFALIFSVTIGLNLHFPALITDRGGAAVQATSAVATVGIASLIGRLLTGPLLDRFSLKVLAAVFFIGQAVGCLLLLRADTSLYLIAAVLLGLAQGAELDMMPFAMARRFGKPAYARIYGSAYAVLQVGQIISPLVLGAIFDLTHSYSLGLTAYPVLSLIALALVWYARITPTASGRSQVVEVVVEASPVRESPAECR